MSEKISAIKVLTNQGIYTNPIPISPDAENVTYNDSNVAQTLDDIQAQLSNSSDLENKNIMTGLPVLEFTTTKDISTMSKEQSVEFQYTFKMAGPVKENDPQPPSGKCTLKWQGSSSQRYNKKNYTFKIDKNASALDGWLTWIKSVNHYRTSLSTGNTNTLSEENSRYAGTDYATQWWGNQRKFCLKANYIDSSHARNIASARLWGQMVKARIDNGEISDQDQRASAPNYGAIDGFPIEVKINGVSQGLYTFNIPKENWMLSMGEGSATQQYIIGGENNYAPQCQWNASLTGIDSLTTWEAGKSYSINALVEYDDSIYKCIANNSNNNLPQIQDQWWRKTFDVEYLNNTVDTTNDELAKHKAALNSLNSVITIVANSANNRKSLEAISSLGDSLDINSVYDYFIFTICIANNDAMAKNILYGYNGSKWFLNAYDMDTTFGSDPYGVDLFLIAGDRCNWNTTAYKLVSLMKNNPTKLKQRWDMWRKGKIKQISEDLSSELWAAGYINSALATVTPNNPVISQNPDDQTHYCIISCNEGDKFLIKGVTGGAAARAYAFINSQNTVLLRADQYQQKTLKGVTIIAPSGATQLIVNNTSGVNGTIKKCQIWPAVLSEENVFEVLSNFVKDIPTRDYNIDREIWPDLPLTSSDTVERYIEYYRAHVKILDEQIEEMQPVTETTGQS